MDDEPVSENTRGLKGRYWLIAVAVCAIGVGVFVEIQNAHRDQAIRDLEADVNGLYRDAQDVGMHRAQFQNLDLDDLPSADATALRAKVRSASVRLESVRAFLADRTQDGVVIPNTIRASNRQKISEACQEARHELQAASDLLDDAEHFYSRHYDADAARARLELHHARVISGWSTELMWDQASALHERAIEAMDAGRAAEASNLEGELSALARDAAEWKDLVLEYRKLMDPRRPVEGKDRLAVRGLWRRADLALRDRSTERLRDIVRELRTVIRRHENGSLANPAPDRDRR